MANEVMGVTSEMFESRDEIFAYFSWLNRYYGLHHDDGLQPFMKAKSQQPALKRARQALLLATRSAAKKMNVTTQTLSRLERNEIKGTITLNSLKMAAEALDCELVYAIVPKKRVPFSLQIWKKLYAVARTDGRIKNLKSSAKGAAIGETANDVMNDAKYRKRQGWIQRGIRTFDSRWDRKP